MMEHAGKRAAAALMALALLTLGITAFASGEASDSLSAAEDTAAPALP